MAYNCSLFGFPEGQGVVRQQIGNPVLFLVPAANGEYIQVDACCITGPIVPGTRIAIRVICIA